MNETEKSFGLPAAPVCFEPTLSVDDRDSDDLSWLLVAIDYAGEAFIIDAAQGFHDKDFLANGNYASDAGVLVPEDIPKGSLHKVEKVKIGGGGPDHEGEYWGPEITGQWLQIYPTTIYAHTRFTHSGSKIK